MKGLMHLFQIIGVALTGHALLYGFQGEASVSVSMVKFFTSIGILPFIATSIMVSFVQYVLIAKQPSYGNFMYGIAVSSYFMATAIALNFLSSVEKGIENVDLFNMGITFISLSVLLWLLIFLTKKYEKHSGRLIVFLNKELDFTLKEDDLAQILFSVCYLVFVCSSYYFLFHAAKAS